VALLALPGKLKHHDLHLCCFLRPPFTRWKPKLGTPQKQAADVGVLQKRGKRSSRKRDEL
jgi:hypothetical protein